MNQPLDQLLSDAEQAGVVWMPSDALPGIRAAANALDFAVCDADLRGCVDQEQVLARLGTALQLPHWYGANWDALEDCLNDMDWLPAPGYLLLLTGLREWTARDQEGEAMLLEIGRTAARRWSELGTPFWTVLETDHAEP